MSTGSGSGRFRRGQAPRDVLRPEGHDVRSDGCHERDSVHHRFSSDLHGHELDVARLPPRLRHGPDGPYHVCGRDPGRLRGKRGRRGDRPRRGAVLLERLSPGGSLAAMALGGHHEAATRILVEMILRMAPRSPRWHAPTVADWGRAFERYAASGDGRIPKQLIAEASRMHSEGSYGRSSDAVEIPAFPGGCGLVQDLALTCDAP